MEEITTCKKSHYGILISQLASGEDELYRQCFYCGKKWYSDDDWEKDSNEPCPATHNTKD